MLTILDMVEVAVAAVVIELQLSDNNFTIGNVMLIYQEKNIFKRNILLISLLIPLHTKISLYFFKVSECHFRIPPSLGSGVYG